MNMTQFTADDAITVTKPYMPPLSEFVPYLESIWQNKTLTNNGPFHQQLEQELADYLGVKYISLFSNATLALMVAMQTLRLKGEVITTPYSFVATAHSILWNNLTPVFVDIDPDTLNMDPGMIEQAITSNTSAIMPVHVYGRPCDTRGIADIADRYGLRTIYDAAHAFGVEDADGSVLNHGDLSVISFHATKVFNTFEGGAVVCPDLKTKVRIDYLKNFGFANELSIVAPGINGKMNELQSAFGLLQLKHIDKVILQRKAVDDFYRKNLRGIKGITLPQAWSYPRHNYSYFPIFVENDYALSRDELYQKLKENNIYARRYFYPLISEMSMYKSFSGVISENLPVATALSRRVLCLPIYPGLETDDLQYIVELIK